MAIRVTAQYIDVAVSGVQARGIRVEAQHVEVAGTLDLGAAIRVEAQHVEIAGTLDFETKLRMTSQFVEVLRSSDHRGLTGILGTLQAGLATETLQAGAGSQAPSFFEPENTGKLGSRSSLPGGHLITGQSAIEDAISDTGEIGTSDAVLNLAHILGFGAIFGVHLGESPIALSDQVGLTLVVGKLSSTDIDIDGTWTTTATSSIKSSAAVTTISGLSQNASPGLFTLSANNTIVLTQITEPGVSEGFASSNISLSQSAEKQASISSVDANNTITLSDMAVNNVFIGIAENTITLTQSETVAGPTELTANNTIPISDTADGIIDVYGRVAENTVVFFGFDPSQNPPTPVPGWDTVTSSIRSLLAQNPDLSGDPPESTLLGGFTDGWTQEARLADTFDLTASNIITITDFLPQPTGKRSVFANNVLALLDFADNNVKSRVVVTPVGFTQTVTFEKVILVSNTLSMSVTVEEGFISLLADNTLTLTDVGRLESLPIDSVTTLALTQEAVSSIRNLAASNIISVTQDINVQRPYLLEAENKVQGITDDIFVPPFGPTIPGVPFGLAQIATVQVDPIRDIPLLINISDLAQVVHINVNAIDLSADTLIGLVQIANLSLTGGATTVIDTLLTIAGVDKNTTDVITPLDGLSNIALFSVDRANKPASNILDIQHAVAYSLIRDTTDCDYTPFVGSSDAQTTPPRPLLPEPLVPALDPSIRFRLVYPPFDTGATVDTLDMRAPNFGNRERLEATRIARETVGGSLTVFADPIWPKVHSLQMQFQALKTDQARGLLNFMERWLGQEIGIYDYEGRIWKGVITNPDEAVTHDGKESYSASLDIEAERVYQLNQTALTNLGMVTMAGEDEVLVLSGINIDQDADFIFNPVAPVDSAIDMVGSADYTKVPVGSGNNVISTTHFARRNSFFYESAESPISFGQTAAQIDFNDFGNLIHNWDAENTPGLNGSVLSSWDDLGSNPVTLNATVSQEPTVRDGILNSRRVVEFRHTGEAQRLLSASTVPLFDLTNKVGTIFIVMIVREVLTNGNEVILGNNTDKIMLGGTGSTERPVAFSSGDGVVTLETPQSVLVNPSNQLLMVRRNGNNITFRRNKVNEDGTTLITNPSPIDDTLFFGGFTGAGSSIDQDIAQVLMYDDVLSDSDILTVESLLSVKWGV